MMTVVVLLQGLATFGFALAPTFWLGAPLLAVVGAGSLCSVAVLNTAVQTASPPELRGRILAFWILFYIVAYPGGSYLEGFLADALSPAWSLGLAGAAITATGVVLWFRRALAESLDWGPTDVEVVDPIPAAPA
jgi:hypothetical protein